MVKEDEKELLSAVVDKGDFPYRVREIVEELGMNENRAAYIFQKWADKGWYDYGVNVLSGWMMGTGWAVLLDLTIGDFVTRDGTDVHFVLSLDSDLVKVVCVVEPNDKWAKPGELENNLTRRYTKIIDADLLVAAKTTYQSLIELHPAGWWY